MPTSCRALLRVLAFLLIPSTMPFPSQGAEVFETNLTQQVPAKTRLVEDEILRRAALGEDVQAASRRLEKIKKQTQAAQLTQADASLDDLIRGLAEGDHAPASGPERVMLARRLKAKGALVARHILTQAEAGRPVDGVVRDAKRGKTLADAGDFQQADALLDAIIVALDRPETSPSPSATAPASSFASSRRVEIDGYDSHCMEPFISRDGQYLFFNNLNDPSVNTNIYYATRDSHWRFRFAGEVQGVNTPALEGVPSMDRNGVFYFISTREYAKTFVSVFRGQFRDGKVTQVEPVKGLSWNKAGWINMDAEISADGETLYYTQSFFDGGSVPIKSDLLVAKRTADGRFAELASPSPVVKLNSPALEYAPATSRDELEIFLTRGLHLGGAPRFEILRAQRQYKGDAFGATEVVPVLAGVVEAPSLSSDGLFLYYHRMVGGTFAIFVAERGATPPVNR